MILSRERYATVEDAAKALGAPGRFVSVGGRPVHVIEAGPAATAGGDPPLVLLHGFGFHAGIFAEVAADLAARGRRTIAIDLFGFGFSARPSAPAEVRYGYDLWQEQLRGVLDALAIERADLAGQSLGAGTAAAFAADHPARARRLVLICPAGLPNPASPSGGVLAWPVLGELLLRLPGNGLQKKALRDFFIADPAKVTDALAGRVGAPTAIRGSAAAMLYIIRNVDLGGIEDRIRRFGALGKRSLVLWGNDDRAIRVELLADRWREIVKPKRFVLLGTCGHCPALERPAEVAHAIAEFLEEKKED